MSFRSYLILMGAATLAAWGAFAVVVTLIDPVRAGALGFFFFYTTLFAAVFGTASVVGVVIRMWAWKEEIVSRHVMRASRQALLLGILVVGSLFLLAKGLFSILTALLFIAFLTILELVFLSFSHARRRNEWSAAADLE